MDFTDEKPQVNLYGAEHLADIYGTEKDKVNCPFYWKIGACRHGERCTRLHNKPTISQSLVIPHMFPNPRCTPLMDPNGNPVNFTEEFLQNHFEDFLSDAIEEFTKYGDLLEINVCDNICEHLLGNVYLKYRTEEDSQKALKGLAGRFYAGRTMVPEFSPVTDFREARCRQFETAHCGRGGICNFMHLKKPVQETRYFIQKPFKNSKRSPSPTRNKQRHRSLERDERGFNRRSHRSKSPERKKRHYSKSPPRRNYDDRNYDRNDRGNRNFNDRGGQYNDRNDRRHFDRNDRSRNFERYDRGNDRGNFNDFQKKEKDFFD